MADMTTAGLTAIGYVAAGATIGGGLLIPLLRHLFTAWQKEQEKYKASTTQAIYDITSSVEKIHTSLPLLEQKVMIAVGAAEDKALAASESVRREGETARKVLADHVDHEDGKLRERYHELSGLLSTAIVKIEIAEHNVEKAFNANQETMKWAVSQFEGLRQTVHNLDRTLAGLSAVLQTLQQN